MRLQNVNEPSLKTSMVQILMLLKKHYHDKNINLSK